MRWLAVIFMYAVGLSSVANAEKRVALVIGNAAYRTEGQLTNPVNDAQLISDALGKIDFEIVDTRANLGIADFRRSLRTFQGNANGADVALVYFAGHGIEANGINWLLPTDAELAEDRDLEYEAIKADLVMQALQGAKVRILVLDACRNNPFGRSWRTGTRSVNRGLGKLETDDVLVLFAAAPGQTASDGASGNSPFAIALAKRLLEPGLAIQFLGGSVRDDVLAATGGVQRPFVSASISGRPIYLRPSQTEQNSAAGTSPSHPEQSSSSKSPTPQLSQASEAWMLVKESTSIPALESFMRRFPDTFQSELAKQRLEELKNGTIAASVNRPSRASNATENVSIIAMDYVHFRPRSKPPETPQKAGAGSGWSSSALTVTLPIVYSHSGARPEPAQLLKEQAVLKLGASSTEFAWAYVVEFAGASVSEAVCKGDWLCRKGNATPVNLKSGEITTMRETMFLPAADEISWSRFMDSILAADGPETLTVALRSTVATSGAAGDGRVVKEAQCVVDVAGSRKRMLDAGFRAGRDPRPTTWQPRCKQSQ